MSKACCPFNEGKYLLIIFLIMAGVLAAAFVSSCITSDESNFAQPRADIARSDIPDPELSPSVKVKTITGGKSDDFDFKQTLEDDNGKSILEKIVWNNNKRYLHPTGHYVSYLYYDDNGKLEKEKLVFPEPQLTSSVVAVYSERHFDADGNEILYKAVRPDGSTAVRNRPGQYETYRTDGTLRSIQINSQGSTRQLRFRPDGKTPWWQFFYLPKGMMRGKVYFDLEGQPYEKQFWRQSLLKDGGYSMNSSSAPIPYCQDNFLRDDGSLEYRQTWTVFWNHEHNENSSAYVSFTRDVLTELEIFDADGTGLIARFGFEYAKTGKHFIRRAEQLADNGNWLVRDFDEAGESVKSETLYSHRPGSNDQEPTILSSKTFPSGKKWQESFDKRMLHGFELNTNGRYDDDSWER